MDKPWCRFLGLCPSCRHRRYDGDGGCLGCGHQGTETLTLVAICGKQCDVCLLIERLRGPRPGKEPA